ncbi:MAG: zeta toxin family protein [Deltaproteobacteria bacterium]|nr:zeta toxin family protein [Deltaproteobacteria bacterium]
MNHPHLYIIAGPNGAGKTTFAKYFLPKYAHCSLFVNADMIAQGLSPFSPELAAIKAGKLYLEEVKEWVQRRKSFAFEATLSGKTYVALLKQAKDRGYKIHIFFILVQDSETAIARVKDRVAKGGHNVPTEEIKRRFVRSRENFFKIYMKQADSWHLIDNSSRYPRLIAKRERIKEIVLIDPARYHQINEGME